MDAGACDLGQLRVPGERAFGRLCKSDGHAGEPRPRPIGVAWRWPSNRTRTRPADDYRVGTAGLDVEGRPFAASSTAREGDRLDAGFALWASQPAGRRTPGRGRRPGGGLTEGAPLRASTRTGRRWARSPKAPLSQSPAVAGAGTRSFAGWPRCLLTRGRVRAATDHYTEAWRVRLRLSSRWRRRGHGVAVAHDDEPE